MLNGVSTETVHAEARRGGGSAISAAPRETGSPFVLHHGQRITMSGRRVRPPFPSMISTCTSVHCGTPRGRLANVSEKPGLRTRGYQGNFIFTSMRLDGSAW